MPISFAHVMDSAQAHRVERFDFRVPDVVVELEQTREYVRKARRPPRLAIRRRHTAVLLR
jgi:hypothetical protein